LDWHIDAVVRQVVDEYLSRLEPVVHKKKLVIVLAYESVQQVQILKAVQSIIAEHDVSVFASETWYTQAADQLKPFSVLKLPHNHQALIEELRLAEALVAPSISYGYIAKLSMTMDDDSLLYASIAMQLQGKPVIVCDDNLAFDVWEAPHGVARRVISYLRQLENENVSVVKLAEVSAAVTQLTDRPAKKRLISAEQVRTLAAKGQRELIISKQAIVTPMARDILRQHGMAVIFRDEKGRG
jgi:hypothetical protein